MNKISISQKLRPLRLAFLVDVTDSNSLQMAIEYSTSMWGGRFNAMTGFARHNLGDLWIDPADYQQQLVQAVETLVQYKMRVSISNHQLCALNKRLWPYSLNKISDWQSIYMPECEPCAVKNKCAGFFASAYLRHSDNIKPFEVAPTDDDTQKIRVFVR